MERVNRRPFDSANSGGFVKKTAFARQLQRCSAQTIFALLALCVFRVGIANPAHISVVASDVAATSFGPSNLTRAVAAGPGGIVYVGFFSGSQLRVAKSI